MKISSKKQNDDYDDFSETKIFEKEDEIIIELKSPQRKTVITENGIV